jgi:hypothetical protein
MIGRYLILLVVRKSSSILVGSGYFRNICVNVATVGIYSLCRARIRVIENSIYNFDQPNCGILVLLTFLWKVFPRKCMKISCDSLSKIPGRLLARSYEELYGRYASDELL